MKKDCTSEFETLCDVLGERFVGYALIVGVQISGLTIDQFNPTNTLVDYKLNELSHPNTIRLLDFRREIVKWLMTATPKSERVVPPLGPTQAQNLVGIRNILLAPLHNISLKEVILEKAGLWPKASVVAVFPDVEKEKEDELTVNKLQELINSKVEDELKAMRERDR